MEQVQAKSDSLTKKLRDYSVKYVKISEKDKDYTRTLFKSLVEDQIIMYCLKKSTLPILRLEYTGSVYERLKTEAADEVDVMVVLKTTESEVSVQTTGAPGYDRLLARADSNFRKFASSEGYINSKRLRNSWFYSLVDQAVNDWRARSPLSDLDMVVRAHGPAVQLDICKKSTGKRRKRRNNLVSVDLVPCFEIGPDSSYYVAKPHKGCKGCRNLRWRQSFSLKEKQILEYMDRDHGCRHELLRIVKTIANRQPASLGRLRSYHLKTAFMRYIKEKRQNWNGQNSLSEHFLGFLGELQRFLESGNLPHYWLDGVNILEDVKDVVVSNMAYRLRRILNSEAERDKILK